MGREVKSPEPLLSIYVQCVVCEHSMWSQAPAIRSRSKDVLSLLLHLLWQTHHKKDVLGLLLHLLWQTLVLTTVLSRFIFAIYYVFCIISVSINFTIQFSDSKMKKQENNLWWCLPTDVALAKFMAKAAVHVLLSSSSTIPKIHWSWVRRL